MPRIEMGAFWFTGPDVPESVRNFLREPDTVYGQLRTPTNGASTVRLNAQDIER